MAITFEQFFSAISKQESGGNYKAIGVWVRGDRAYGKYQVMGANIPSWTRQYLGYSMSPQQYLNSPAAQEKVARGRLKSYWDKYGARGAAAAWYSGNASLHMSTRPQSGGPSIKAYVDSVLNHAKGYPPGGSTDPGSTSTTYNKSKRTGTTKPKSREELAEDYGFVEGMFSSNKELKTLFDKAVKGQWTTAKFQAELRDTKWWKSTTKQERDFLTKKWGDPATAKQELKSAYIKIRQMANQLGMVESKWNLKKMNEWAYNIVAKGWDEGRLRYELGKYVYFGDDKRQGEGGEVMDKLKSYAYEMGVTMSGKWYADKTRNVIRGLATEQDYEDEIRRQAKSIYSQWGKQIDAGQTVSDLASPYMQSMAQILELPAGSVNTFNPLIKKALQAKDKQTGANMIKPIWQFENELRNDPRWKQTKNAQDSVMQVAHQVLVDFGVKY